MKTITIPELQNLLAASDNTLYLDVRTKKEFQQEHIEGFINIPLNELNTNKSPNLNLNQYDTIVISCASGMRSQKACNILKGKTKNILNVQGGILEWKKHNLPTHKKPSNHISTQRQVQIIVGSSALTSAWLAHTLHINYIWIAGAVGTGLLVAGLTNTCLLATVLEKAPWNK